MTGHSEALTSIAFLLSDPSRAEMLVAMMDGRSYPCSDLATYAHVSPSTASHHLSLLVDAGLVEAYTQGKHRYHRIARSEVAELIESIGSVGNKRKTRCSPALADCRSCYDHLAGRFGVELRISCENRGWLRFENGLFQITTPGERFFSNFGIDIESLRTHRRPLVRACLDWTERVPHIGGALGAALMSRFLERSWLERGPVPRSVLVTPIGKECFNRLFGCVGLVDDLSSSAIL